MTRIPLNQASIVRNLATSNPGFKYIKLAGLRFHVAGRIFLFRPRKENDLC
jgi:hypothetical protein